MDKTKVVSFMSHGRKARCAPDPLYPAGMDIDLAGGAQKACVVDLPYPAECCGVWLVWCETCGYSAGVTAAGRVDDPRTVKLPCRATIARDDGGNHG